MATPECAGADVARRCARDRKSSVSRRQVGGYGHLETTLSSGGIARFILFDDGHWRDDPDFSSADSHFSRFVLHGPLGGSRVTYTSRQSEGRSRGGRNVPTES